MASQGDLKLLPRIYHTDRKRHKIQSVQSMENKPLLDCISKRETGFTQISETCDRQSRVLKGQTGKKCNERTNVEEVSDTSFDARTGIGIANRDMCTGTWSKCHPSSFLPGGLLNVLEGRFLVLLLAIEEEVLHQTGASYPRLRLQLDGEAVLEAQSWAEVKPFWLKSQEARFWEI